MVLFLCGGIRASRAYDRAYTAIVRMVAVDRAYTAIIRMVAVVILALLYTGRTKVVSLFFFFAHPILALLILALC